MEKLMYVVWKDSTVNEDEFQQLMRDSAAAFAASKLRFTFIDAAIAPAESLRIRSKRFQTLPSAVVSFWLDSSTQRATQEAVLEKLCAEFAGYVVTESEPLVNRDHPAQAGERTYGMNQVVFFQKPTEMDYAKWIDIWHNSHTQVAIDTQSTFGYRQNVVSRALTANAPAVDAIVEENFPPEAMTSPHAFYNTAGDEALLKQRQTEMFESVQRFIDLEKLDCLPMSEYNF